MKIRGKRSAKIPIHFLCVSPLRTTAWVSPGGQNGGAQWWLVPFTLQLESRERSACLWVCVGRASPLTTHLQPKSTLLIRSLQMLSLKWRPLGSGIKRLRTAQPCSAGRKRICPCKVSRWWLSAYLGHQFEKEKGSGQSHAFLWTSKVLSPSPIFPFYCLVSWLSAAVGRGCVPRRQTCLLTPIKLQQGTRRQVWEAGARTPLRFPWSRLLCRGDPPLSSPQPGLQLLRTTPPDFRAPCAGDVRKPVSYPSFLDPHVPTPARQNILVQLTFTKTQATRGDGEGQGGLAGRGPCGWSRTRLSDRMTTDHWRGSRQKPSQRRHL